MATLSNIIRSPNVYAGKALSIARHQALLLVRRIRNLKFRLIEALTPTASVDLGRGGVVRLYAPSVRSLLRAGSMLTKEPGTNAWIDSFEEGCLFWDIGANIGIYSLMAARRRGARVLAFEPLYTTFANLVRNIEINGLGDRAGAFCIAFNSVTKVDSLFIRESSAGYSGNAFGKPVDQTGNTYDYGAKLDVLGYSVDDFIRTFALDVPNYIKLDVDGIELQILKGAAKTLRDPRLRSVLVEQQEMLPAALEETTALMAEAGFHVESRHLLSDGPTDRSTNYIFMRT